MTLEAPFLLHADSYSPRQFRELVDSAFPPAGYIFAEGLLVAASQPGGGDPPLSVDVSPGVDTIIGTDGARYLCANTARYNVQLEAAPGAGLSRIDAIYDMVLNAGSEWLIDKVTGQSSSSPVSPTCPSSSNPLAYVLVNSNAQSIDNEHITAALSSGAWYVRAMGVRA